MPSLIDTHAHIYADQFGGDLDDVIERARNAGVETIIVPATVAREYHQTLALCDRYPEVRAAVGVHPHHAAEVDDTGMSEIERLAGEGKAIAIGEIGLDYYYDFAPRERQQEVFRRQLRLARQLDLPAVVHNRESDADVLAMIDREQDGSLRFQLHCFSSTLDVLKQALDLGGMISFTGNVTFPKAALDDIVRAVPDDRMMIETDAPYLTPVPYRGKRNEPGYVALVAERIASIRGVSLETITQMTTDNARRFFRLAVLLLVLLGISTYESYAQTRKKRANRKRSDTAQVKRIPATKTTVVTFAVPEPKKGPTAAVRNSAEIYGLTDSSNGILRPVDFGVVVEPPSGQIGIIETDAPHGRLAALPPDSPATTRRPPQPVRTVDTTPKTTYDRTFGFGGHMASSSYISGATTLATELGYGLWFSVSPLRWLDIEWLQLDLMYTNVNVPGVADSAYKNVGKAIGDSNAARGINPPGNVHSTIDIAARFTANPSALITFFASMGASRFHNEFGVDQYIIERGGDTTLKDYREDVWGLSGGIGLSVNIKVPYMTITPIGELRFMAVTGDRPLPKRSAQFQVSQFRFGLLVYPDFQGMFR